MSNNANLFYFFKQVLDEFSCWKFLDKMYSKFLANIVDF